MTGVRMPEREGEIKREGQGEFRTSSVGDYTHVISSHPWKGKILSERK